MKWVPPWYRQYSIRDKPFYDINLSRDEIGCEAASTNRSVPAKQASKMPISNIKRLRHFVEVVVSCILKTDRFCQSSLRTSRVKIIKLYL